MGKSLFDAVVGTPPPSTVDVAAIVRRRRRVRAVRRLGVMLAPVVVACVATAVALVTVGDGGGEPDYAAQPALVPTTISAPGATSGLTADRLRTALAEAVAAVVPDAIWLPDGQPPVLKPPLPATSGAHVIVTCDALRCEVYRSPDVPTLDTSFSGIAALQRAGNTGWVMVALHSTRSWLDCEGTLANETCAAGSSPHGYAMVTRSMRPSTLPDGMTGPIPVTTRTVAIELPGDGVLEFGVNGPKDPTEPPDMVLSEAELVSVADDVVHRVNG